MTFYFHFSQNYKLIMYPAGSHLDFFKDAKGGIRKTIWMDHLKDYYESIPLRTEEQIALVMKENGECFFLGFLG